MRVFLSSAKALPGPRGIKVPRKVRMSIDSRVVGRILSVLVVHVLKVLHLVLLNFLRLQRLAQVLELTFKWFLDPPAFGLLHFLVSVRKILLYLSHNLFTELVHKPCDLLYLLYLGKWLDVDVVLEEPSSFDECPADRARVNHDSEAFLNALVPLTLVLAAVDPLHGSPAVSNVILEVARVLVAHLPSELAVAVFLVIFVLTLELVEFAGLRRIRGQLLPLALALLEALLKVSTVLVAVRPQILAIALRKASRILASVLVSVSKEVCAVTVSETGFPLALVPVSF